MLQRFERFSLAIAEINRCWHKLAAEEMALYGLNSPHALYLSTLYQYEDGVTAAKLAELCWKDKADVSRMISILEQKGLVQKEATGRNRYRALIKLTDEGTQAAMHVRSRAAFAVERAGAGLSDNDREIFYTALGLITDNLRTLSKEGLPKD